MRTSIIAILLFAGFAVHAQEYGSVDNDDLAQESHDDDEVAQEYDDGDDDADEAAQQSDDDEDESNDDDDFAQVSYDDEEDDAQDDSETLDDSLDNLADALVDKLISQEFMVWATDPADVDDTTLAAMKAMKAMKAMAAMKAMKAMKAKKAMKAMKAMKKKRVSKIAKGKMARSMVLRGSKVKTTGGLKASDLTKNKNGRVVSKKASASAKKNKWAIAVGKARKALGLKGFVPVKKGSALYKKVKDLSR